jgi:hypothetical protein
MLGWVSAFTLLYFLTTLLGLALFAQPFDAIPFWPASGIAAGILSVATRRAYPPLLLAWWPAPWRRNLVCDRSLFDSISSGIANAGESPAGRLALLKRWFGEALSRFPDLSRIAGFSRSGGRSRRPYLPVGGTAFPELAARLRRPWSISGCAWYPLRTLGINRPSRRSLSSFAARLGAPLRRYGRPSRDWRVLALFGLGCI